MLFIASEHVCSKSQAVSVWVCIDMFPLQRPLLVWKEDNTKAENKSELTTLPALTLLSL